MNLNECKTEKLRNKRSNPVFKSSYHSSCLLVFFLFVGLLVCLTLTIRCCFKTLIFMKNRN